MSAVQLDLRAEAEAHRRELTGIDGLDALEARLVANTWRGRMVNEHISARVFGGLLGPAMAAGVSPARQQQLVDFAGEELHHARLCAGVLLSLGGEAQAELPPLPPLPIHADAEPLEAFMRNVLSICCLSETCATALIAAERLDAVAPEIQEVLGVILADEVGHARFGWKLLEDGVVDASLARRLEAYLPVAFAHLETHELAHLGVARPSDAAVHCGACDGAAARDIFFDTVTEVIVPRLESHGLGAAEAWRTRSN